jgi:uncharacterized membrane protein
MRKKIILTLAILIIMLPFTGFPDSWKSFMTIVFSFVIIFFAYRDDIWNFFSIANYPPGRIVEGDSFVESTGPQQNT